MLAAKKDHEHEFQEMGKELAYSEEGRGIASITVITDVREAESPVQAHLEKKRADWELEHDSGNTSSGKF
jgi:ERCC4-type nuclease